MGNAGVWQIKKEDYSAILAMQIAHTHHTAPWKLHKETASLQLAWLHRRSLSESKNQQGFCYTDIICYSKRYGFENTFLLPEHEAYASEGHQSHLSLSSGSLIATQPWETEDEQCAWVTSCQCPRGQQDQKPASTRPKHHFLSLKPLLNIKQRPKVIQHTIRT